MKNNTLLTGGSGTLGKIIIKKKGNKEIFYPTSKNLDILNITDLKKFILKKKN